MASTGRAGRAGGPDAATIEVRDSGVHGQGVFALRDIPAGASLGRYAGRRYACDAELGERDSQLTYLFGLSDGSLIDGGDGGNAMRHLNHACEPNVTAHERRGRGGRLQIDISTLRGIGAGEELFLDYALTIDGDPGDYGCRCGAGACRGTMAAPASADRPATALDCAA